MSFKKALGRLLLFAVLNVGALAGVPMTPDDIEKLMQVMHRTKVVHILRTENGEDPENR